MYYLANIFFLYNKLRDEQGHVPLAKDKLSRNCANGQSMHYAKEGPEHFRQE